MSLSAVELTDRRNRANTARRALLARVRANTLTILEAIDEASTDDALRKIQISKLLVETGLTPSAADELLAQLAARTTSKKQPITIGWLLHSQSPKRLSTLIELLDTTTPAWSGFPWGTDR